MPRFTAVMEDREDNSFDRVVCTANSADDVEKLAQQHKYEEIKGDLDEGTALGDIGYHAICVFAGDHPNLFSSELDVNDVVIDPNWSPNDDTPTE